MNSDSTSEDDHDEFFETFDCIGTPSPNDASEIRNGMKYTRQLLPSSHAPSSFASSFSKYELWKATPGNIAERRWRLRVHMGLESQHHPFSVTVSNEGSRGAYLDSSLPESVVTHSKEDANPDTYGRKEHDSIDLKDQANYASDTVRSRSNDASSILQNINGVFDSGSMEAPQSDAFANDLSNISIRSERHSSSKPPLSTRKVNRNTLVGLTPTEELLRRRSQTYSDRLSKSNDADKNVGIVSDPNEAFYCSIREGSGKINEIPIASIDDDDGVENDVALCRMTDLDSGRVFTVKRSWKNEMSDRLEEIQIGKGCDIEQAKSSKQGVMKREKATDDDHVMGIQVNTAAKVQKTRRGWFKVIKGVVMGLQGKGSYSGSEDREASTGKSRRSGSTTDDSQDTSILGRPVKIRAYRKTIKEFGGLHMRQEIHAHEGPILVIKFSHDGAYLATAGQDKLVKVWEVLEKSVGSKETADDLGDFNSNLEKLDDHLEWNSKNRSGLKINSSFQVNKLFGFFEVPKCTFKGHTEDILDLSWSPSQLLLSSSMDKTVRLWKLSCSGCLKVFKHNDYVTCIQFHPLDDDHFISGSLDGKVRVWRIQEPQVVDWVDVREMVTAACYAPDGKSAFVGSYKGTCRLYKTSGGMLQPATTFEVRRNKTRQSQAKKITGFQFMPKHKRKVLITSSDSRIRIYDGTEVISKYKGFKNTKSQFAASCTSDGQYIVCASEGSRVYIWNYSDSELEYPGSQRKLSSSYERFACENVSVAISWPGISHDSGSECIIQSEVIDDKFSAEKKGVSCHVNSTIMPGSLGDCAESEALSCADEKFLSDRISCMTMQKNVNEIRERRSPASHPENRRVRHSNFRPTMLDSYLEDCCGMSSCMPNQNLGGNSGFFVDSKGSATWPEEKLQSFHQSLAKMPIHTNVNTIANVELINDKDVAAVPSPALGIVIVTASLEGDIRIFQNFGLPVRL